MFIDGQGCTVSTTDYQLLVDNGARLCIYNLNLRLGKTSFGLKWKYVGDDEPAGRELTNTQLVNALRNKTTFTQVQWDSFGIKDLRSDDFVGIPLTGHAFYFYQPIAIGKVCAPYLNLLTDTLSCAILV